MTSRLAIVLAVVELLLLWTLIRYARRGQLALRYVLAAIALIAAFTLVIAVPAALTWLADFTGVQSWLSALLGVFAAISVWVFLRLTAEVSRLSTENVRLAQDLAILRAQAHLDERRLGNAGTKQDRVASEGSVTQDASSTRSAPVSSPGTAGPKDPSRSGGL